MTTKIWKHTLRIGGGAATAALLSGAVAVAQQQTQPTTPQQQTTTTERRDTTQQQPGTTTQQQPSTTQSERSTTTTTTGDSTQSPSSTQSTSTSSSTQTSTSSSASGDIVETARQAGNFNTLVSLIEAAGMTDTLKSGQFTVFAPTDDAFAKLPANALTDLQKPENKDKLKAILSYHVVPGKVMASDVAKLDGKTAKTVQGSELPVSTAGGVKIGNATVSKTDIAASNGVIHVIDTVLMPTGNMGAAKKGSMQ